MFSLVVQLDQVFLCILSYVPYLILLLTAVEIGFESAGHIWNEAVQSGQICIILIGLIEREIFLNVTSTSENSPGN